VLILNRHGCHRRPWKKANLRGANLITADLSKADLSEADLSKANLWGAHLWGAFLENAKFGGANLREARLGEADLRGAHPEDAQSLEDANLRGVKGLTEEQLKACKAKGAIIDEAFTTSSSQSPVASPPLSKSNDGQVSSAQSVQESTPTPDTDGSSAASSKPGHES
jgi:uncharacterized protein YjbI with pentapeptide repeats